MSVNPLPLLERLKIGNYENCVIVTFNADLYFYEQVVLRILRSRGCRNNMVFMDQRQYELAIECQGDVLESIGRLYSVASKKVAGAFHPKLILQTNDTGARLFLGSGNLTVRGFSSNWELFAETTARKVGKHDGLFKQAWLFIRALAEGCPRSVATQLSHLEASSAWLTDDRASAEWPKFLVAKDDQPSLISQIQSAIQGQDVTRLIVVSPFFDRQLLAIQELDRTFNPNEISLVVQPDHVSLPGEKLRQFDKVRVTRFEPPQAHKSGEAYLHAKAIIFQTRDNEYCLWGSPNCSDSALHRGANVETAMLQKATAGTFIETLGLGPSLETEIADPQALRFRADASDGDSTQHDGIGGLSAEYDGTELVVYVETARALPDYCQCKLFCPASKETTTKFQLEKQPDRNVYSGPCQISPSDRLTLCHLVFEIGVEVITSAPAVLHFLASIQRESQSRRHKDLAHLADAIVSGSADWAKGLQRVCELLFKIEAAEGSRTAQVRNGKLNENDQDSLEVEREGEQSPGSVKDYEQFVAEPKSSFEAALSTRTDFLTDMIDALSSRMQIQDTAAEESKYREEEDIDSAERGEVETPYSQREASLDEKQFRRTRNSYRKLTKQLLRRSELLRDGAESISADELLRLTATNYILLNGCERQQSHDGLPVLASEELLCDYPPILEIFFAKTHPLQTEAKLLIPLALRLPESGMGKILDEAVCSTCLLISGLLHVKNSLSEQPNLGNRRKARLHTPLELLTFARTANAISQLNAIPTMDTFSEYFDQNLEKSIWLETIGRNSVVACYREIKRLANVVGEAELLLDQASVRTGHDELEVGDWVCARSTGVSQILKIEGNKLSLARLGHPDDKTIKIRSSDTTLIASE